MLRTPHAAIGLMIVAGAVAACEDYWPQTRPVSYGFESHSEENSYERGKVELEAGRLGLAMQMFRAELIRHPESVDAMNGIAVTYERLGRPDLAEQYLTEALALEPRAAQSLNNLGFLYARQGRRDLALSFLERRWRRASGKPGAATRWRRGPARS